MVSRTEQELESLILGDPLDDSLRIELEQLLVVTERHDFPVELLRRERLIAEALERFESIDDQMNEYESFRIAQSDNIWDRRGFTDHLFRPFSLWVVHCDPTREFALNIALRNETHQKFDIHSLPVEIVRSDDLRSAWRNKQSIIDFVSRYRGPSGLEPELSDNEIRIAILPTYSRQAPK